jgi:hypothetical protein
MSSDKEQALLEELDRLNNQRLAIAMKLSAVRGQPMAIDFHDQESINRNIDNIANGLVVVKDIEGEKNAPVLAANEILSTDHKKLSKHLADIASGRMVVVSAGPTGAGR